MNAPPEEPSDASRGDDDAAVILLRLLEEHPDYSQRQLARALGLSLGKTHYLLKALLAKGWVKAQNFRRSDQKLGYLYVLTPSGIRQRLSLTQAFLARKEQEYVRLRSQISALRKDLADQKGAAPVSGAAKPTVVAAVLADGSGVHLWPVGRPLHSKQYLPLGARALAAVKEVR